MTTVERYSLQTGKGNKFTSGYSMGGILDSYIIARYEDRARSRIILDESAYNAMIEDAAEKIQAEIAKDLQNVLKNF